MTALASSWIFPPYFSHLTMAPLLGCFLHLSLCTQQFPFQEHLSFLLPLSQPAFSLSQARSRVFPVGKLCKPVLPVWVPASLLSLLGYLCISVFMNSLTSETESQAFLNLTRA